MAEGRTLLKSEQSKEKRYKEDKSQTGWPFIMFAGGSERLASQREQSGRDLRTHPSEVEKYFPCLLGGRPLTPWDG